jgi:NADH dehydrogenase
MSKAMDEYVNVYELTDGPRSNKELDSTVELRRPSPARLESSRAEQHRHRIVVVGGGAAGLELATRLGDRQGRRGWAEITLVDRDRTHIWKPLLHEVAAGTLSLAENELSYFAQAHWHGFHYRFGEMIGLDRARKEVHLAATFDDEGRELIPPRAIGYDTLVIAIGSLTNDFGTPGVAEHAMPLETPAHAARFNRRLIDACTRAQTQLAPSVPASFTLRSSARAQPAPNSPRNCIALHTNW